MSSGDVLSMSLDDIITTNKKNRSNTRGRGNGRKFGANRSAPYNKSSGPRKAGGPKGTTPSQVALASVADKLVVSNLAFSVTQEDVKELFSRIGPVKSASLNYNAEGKSKGVASVVFVKHGDAAKALAEYNGRKLDDRPMRIELVVNPEAPQIQKLALQQSSGPSRGGVAKSQNNGIRGRGQRRRGRGGRTGGAPKQDVSAADLDAEMDAYMNDSTMADASVDLSNALA